MMGPEQLGDLIDRHTASLVLYARQWCAAPEDVVQEAFIKLVGQSRVPECPGAWLYRVVRNGAISAARAEKRRRSHEVRVARSAWFVSTDQREHEATVALARLPLEQREVIVAHLWGGLTFDQIGELASTSAASAFRRYVEGLTALREQLGVPCLKNDSTQS